MPWIALLVGRHLHHIENYARYPGADERGDRCISPAG